MNPKLVGKGPGDPHSKAQRRARKGAGFDSNTQRLGAVRSQKGLGGLGWFGGSTGGLHASGFRVYIGFGLWSPALIFLLGFEKSVCTCKKGGEVPLRSGQSSFCNSGLSFIAFIADFCCPVKQSIGVKCRRLLACIAPVVPQHDTERRQLHLTCGA